VADFIGQTNFFRGRVEEAGASVVVRDDRGLVLRCAPADWAAQGMRVAVTVRPEKVVPASGPVDNRVAGRLERVAYLGDLVQYHIALDGGGDVVCQRQNERDDPASAWRAGDRVEIGWAEASALVLADDEVAQEEDVHLLAEEPAGA
jgi:ABC-type Fe3+/spermidine/putrescine transport system ATPase subunit